jgi:threonine dehydratase
MTTTHKERYSSTAHVTSGDVALEIINAHREAVDEQFRIGELGSEFPRLAQQLGAVGLYLARAGDNLAGAFKWRGAIVGAVNLQAAGAESLVVPSAGNHARGAVLAARILGMNIHVVIPTTAPTAKKEGLRELWDDPRLQVHTMGTSFDDAYAWAQQHPEYGALLHPFDNPDVIAGQGTLVDDMLKDGAVDRLVLPVGGGGLLAGVLSRLHEKGSTHTEVYAVEPDGSNSLSRSIAQGRIVAVEQPNARYGGSAVRRIGRHTLNSYKKHPIAVHTLRVTDEEVDRLTQDYELDRYDLMRRSTPNYEPTTLVALAGLAQVPRDPPGRTIVIGTGHNDSLWQQQK